MADLKEEGERADLVLDIDSKIGHFHEEDYEGDWPRKGSEDIPYVYNEVLHSLARKIVDNDISEFSAIFGSTEDDMRMITHVDAMWYLAHTLFVNTSLERIVIAYGKEVFSNHPSLGYFIANAICKHPTVSTLDLSFNGFVPDTAYYLGRAFLRNTSLKYVNLTGNEFGDKTASSMIAALSMHPSVEMINLSSCGLGRESAIKLAKLVSKSVTLRDLILDDNDFGGAAGVSFLMRGLNKATLNFLSLAGCSLDDSMSYLLSDGISNAQLRSLNIANNRLSDVAGVSLIKALVKTNARSIVLDNNYFGKKTASELGLILAQNSGHLKVVSLNQNEIGKEGSVAIAKAFASNSSVEELYLASNGLGAEFGVTLGLALEVQNGGEGSGSRLKALSVSNNMLGDEGVAGLVLGLKNSTGLQSLDLEGNQLGDKAAVALAPFVKPGSSQIRWLSVESNNIGEIGRAALSGSLIEGDESSVKSSISYAKNLFADLEGPAESSDVIKAVELLEAELATEGQAFHDEGLTKYVSHVAQNQVSPLGEQFSTPLSPGERDPLL